MSIQLDYPLGLTGLTITATAYAATAGDTTGTALTFTENTHRLGYYCATTSALTAGLYWIQISTTGSYFDAQWITVTPSGIVVLVPSHFEGLNQVSLAAGAIDLLQFTSTVKALLIRGYLVTTGSTSPVSTDLWCIGSFYNDLPTYQSFTTGLYAWNNGSDWIISTTIGTNGAAYWTSGSGATIVGPYSAQGTAVGVPVVVGHGNAVAATFQPDWAFLTTNQAATIPSSGTIARTSDIPTAAQNRQEMDANSSKMANLDVPVSSRLAGSSYVAPPTPNAIAATTASVMFVDGATHSLKVNADHTVSASADSVIIQNNVTIPPAVAVASQIPTVITCLRGDTLRVSLPPMGDLTTRTKLVVTAKALVSDSDDLSVLQVVEGIGLSRLNGSNAVTPGTASLSVVDPTTGVVNLEIDASVTALLAVRDLVWDAQAYLASGIVSPIGGIVGVVADVTQAVT